jgi:hypothetical protein
MKQGHGVVISVEGIVPDLPRNNARGKEEQEFLRLCGDAGALKEMANQRQAAYDGHLLDVHALGRDDDAANHHGAAIGNRYFGLGGLGVESRDALNAGNTGVDLRVFHQYIHEDGAFRRDLRGNLKFQHGINELNRNSVIDGRLNRNLSTLLDGGFFIVLRDDFGFRNYLGLPLPTASCGLPASIGRAALDRSRREPWLPS